MEQVEYFDRETETYQDGEITFRNGAFIEVEDREGNRHYPDPLDITWSSRNQGEAGPPPIGKKKIQDYYFKFNKAELKLETGTCPWFTVELCTDEAGKRLNIVGYK